MKKLKIGLLLLIALCAAGYGAFQLFFRTAVPKYTGTLALKGLSAPVEVRSDDYGVPHIIAQNEADLFFAQGYITARERLFQMDTVRLAGHVSMCCCAPILRPGSRKTASPPFCSCPTV
ncbi:MAG: penicillin acylase family protein [Desulfobacteraceae bacterium]|jgi:penicillin amidase|nr:penicillin acylase family protein [Desulfobacteraceae bacterium]